MYFQKSSHFDVLTLSSSWYILQSVSLYFVWKDYQGACFHINSQLVWFHLWCICRYVCVGKHASVMSLSRKVHVCHCLSAMTSHLELLLGFQLHVNSVMITWGHMLRGNSVCAWACFLTSGYCFVKIYHRDAVWSDLRVTLTRICQQMTSGEAVKSVE